MELNAKEGLESIGTFTHRDKDGNIKGEGEILAKKGSVVRDAEGNVIAFTDTAGLDHEVNNDSSN